MFPATCQMISEEKDLVTFLFDMLTKKYDKPAKMNVPADVNCLLQTSTEFRIAKAERHFYNCDFKNCFKETSGLVLRLTFGPSRQEQNKTQ